MEKICKINQFLFYFFLILAIGKFEIGIFFTFFLPGALDFCSVAAFHSFKLVKGIIVMKYFCY